MADVFISYTRDDEILAVDVIAAVESAGFSTWWDDRLTPSEHFDDLIEREIAAAKAVLVLWTPRSARSLWVRSEADYAKENGKLVPVRLEQCDLPLAFRLVQTAILDSWDGEASYPEWQKTLGWIARLVGDGHGAAGAGEGRLRSLLAEWTGLRASQDEEALARFLLDCRGTMVEPLVAARLEELTRHRRAPPPSDAVASA
ncbi:MAG: toll/interleukin-1 receptor domain-containing protein, partial [Caulobacterales bacterium]|nr:toll/interleukin-1 receptor domain-containing protein [Caulobacterales bacterium]